MMLMAICRPFVSGMDGWRGLQAETISHAADVEDVALCGDVHSALLEVSEVDHRASSRVAGGCPEGVGGGSGEGVLVDGGGGGLTSHDAVQLHDIG